MTDLEIEFQADISAWPLCKTAQYVVMLILKYRDKYSSEEAASMLQSLENKTNPEEDMHVFNVFGSAGCTLSRSQQDGVHCITGSIDTPNIYLHESHFTIKDLPAALALEHNRKIENKSLSISQIISGYGGTDRKIIGMERSSFGSKQMVYHLECQSASQIAADLTWSEMVQGGLKP